MTTTKARKNDRNPHAAAIERWDNEGGASSQVSQRKKIEERKVPLSTNRDEQKDS